jgi:3-hydroxyisobutyrate dehydrogenase-like beta-hydroxyacid dehydrogenase
MLSLAGRSTRWEVEGMNPESVTIIGLGQMGSALATVLLDRGHEITVWNRSPQKAKALVDRGAALAASPAEAMAATSLTIACVLDYDVLRSVLTPVEAKTLINLTSGSPEQAVAAEAWAQSHGASYLDGAIMTTPPGVGNPDLMFLYSGSSEVMSAHRATLAGLGDPTFLGADPGLASLYDSALLGLMWATMTGWLHGTAVVTADGAKAVDYTTLAVRWLTAVAGFMTTYAPQVDEGRYPGSDATVDVQIATIDHLIHAAEKRSVDNALPQLLKQAMAKAKATGHGLDSFGSVIEVLRR